MRAAPKAAEAAALETAQEGAGLWHISGMIVEA